MERKLKESERWLAAILRNIGDSVIATDGEWRIRFMNPRAESLTGWDADAAVGRELTEVLRVSLTTVRARYRSNRQYLQAQAPQC